MAEDPIVERALKAYQEHKRSEEEKERQLQAQARQRKITRLQAFLRGIGEDVPDDALPQVPQITRGALTFAIRENDDDDKIHISFRCSFCGRERVSPPVQNLIEMGKFLSSSCVCDDD